MESLGYLLSRGMKKSRYSATKWQSVSLLIDEKEMCDLMETLPPFHIYAVGTVVPRGDGVIDKKAFFSQYTSYIQELKEGRVPLHYRQAFTGAWSLDEAALERTPVGEDRQILQVVRPVIQTQEHTLDYSTADGKFRSMVLGFDTLTWGIHFTFPGLFEDPVTRAVQNVLTSGLFPNAALFKALQSWTRKHTIPAPFQVGGKTVHVPARIGKNCLPWISSHPQLANKGLTIEH